MGPESSDAVPTGQSMALNTGIDVRAVETTHPEPSLVKGSAAMELPSGTVTFLFTDIEGSTRLWEQEPAAMRTALQQHDSLIRDTITSCNGIVFKTIGDAFCVVFAAPTRAVEAALKVQINLRDNEVGLPGTDGSLRPILVRMALHTGQADERDNDYFGPPLNRVSRLLSAGHGGQVLISEITHGLVAHELPPEVTLVDMGVHRLKDLRQAERIYQLTHPNLRSDLPPLRSLKSSQHNLPIQITSFIGREREIDEIKSLIRGTRILTLTGAGGAGKTRLAVQVAAEVIDEEEVGDGVWLAELASVSDPERVASAVAEALGVREEPDRRILKTLADYLEPKRMLLILDNCEHVIDACARLTSALVRQCPHITVLASSRQALGIAGELTYRVPSLKLPDAASTSNVSIEELGRTEAIQLFSERARLHQPSFRLVTENAMDVAQICHKLDGIPLAIELAAARIRAMSAREIAARLPDFRLLTGGSRTAAPRQQTLRGAIEWSIGLLTEDEWTLLKRLSVFVGGWSLEAAEKICAFHDVAPGRGRYQSGPTEEEDSGASGDLFSAGPAQWQVLDLLTALVDKSLVIYEERDGRGRYRLTEALRQYVRERALENGEFATVERRYIGYYLALAEESERKTRGSDQTWWLERLDTEHDNLRAALALRGNSEEDSDIGLRLAGALWWFWHVRGYFTEGREWLTRKLAEASQVSPHRAKALNGAAVLARNQGDYASARTLSQESLGLKRRLEDKQGTAAALMTLATLALTQGDNADAGPLYSEALSLERELGNRQGITSGLIGLGNVAVEQGDYDLARDLFNESLEIKTQLEDRRGVAASLVGLGNIAFAQGDNVLALRLYRESLEIRRRIRDRRNIATSLQQMGLVALAQDDFNSAAAFLDESLLIRQELGDKLGVANTLHSVALLSWKRRAFADAANLLVKCLETYRQLDNRRGTMRTLESLGYVLSELGETELAATLLGTVEVIRAQMGSPVHPSEKAERDNVITRLQELSGHAKFWEAWTCGQSQNTEVSVQMVINKYWPAT